MIDSGDVSVIVQGAIDRKETKKSLKSIRKYLPNAEIILSTWENSDITGLDYDILVENKDPGAVIFTTGKKKVYNNLNRQLLSTQNGLKKAGRRYVFKLRSDLILTNSKFLNYFDEYQERCYEYKLFERKILIAALYTRKFILKSKEKEKYFIPFHPSDFFLFGLNEDIKKYFEETKQVKEPEYSNYFYEKRNLNENRAFNIAMYQYPPEQYFALACFTRYFNDIQMKDFSDVSGILIKQSEIAIVNNFIVLEYPQHGIYMNKYKFSKNEKMLGELEHSGLYHNLAYMKDYKKYCDNQFKIPIKFWWVGHLEVEYSLSRLHKHFFWLIDLKTSPLRRLEQFISIPYYIIHFIITVIMNIPKFIVAAIKGNYFDIEKVDSKIFLK